MPKSILLCWIIIMFTLEAGTVLAERQPLFVGTNLAQQGIYACTLDLNTGELSPASSVGDAPHPGFLAVHPKLPVLYAVTHEATTPAGGLRAFRVDPQTLSLTLLGKQPSGDEGATHLAVDQQGKAILVAHYSGGSTSILPINTVGELGAISSLVKHVGSSVDPNRQTKPYAHGIAIHSSGKFACVADLGTDEIIVYRLDDETKLVAQGAWKAQPGAGPRHLAFHNNGRWLYCINELNSTLSALAFDDATGKLTELHTLSTLPAEFKEWNSTAEVVVHPNGRYVYISNRGHDSTAVFAIEAETGRLSLVEIEPTQGGHPRFIGIDPSGQYLIAANRDANNLVSFQIDPQTGELTSTGYQVSIPQPVCVVFPMLKSASSN